MHVLVVLILEKISENWIMDSMLYQGPPEECLVCVKMLYVINSVKFQGRWSSFNSGGASVGHRFTSAEGAISGSNLHEEKNLIFVKSGGAKAPPAPPAPLPLNLCMCVCIFDKNSVKCCVSVNIAFSLKVSAFFVI